jgi:hypothetical protein
MSGIATLFAYMHGCPGRSAACNAGKVFARVFCQQMEDGVEAISEFCFDVDGGLSVVLAVLSSRLFSSCRLAYSPYLSVCTRTKMNRSIPAYVSGPRMMAEHRRLFREILGNTGAGMLHAHTHTHTHPRR